VARERVLDRELVQVELLFHLEELGGLGILERHPHEALGATHVVADLRLGDVPDALAVLVGDAIDQHRRPFMDSRAATLRRARG
jgi:hypothetical protein